MKKSKNKKYMKKSDGSILSITWKTGALLLCSIVVGAILLIGSYLLPVDRMIVNSKDAAMRFESEGLYPNLANGYKNAQLDNYTDAIIINEAIFKSRDSSLNKSMYVYRNYKTNPVYDVVHTVKNDESGLKKVEYGRYWHGNLIVVKPLLLFFNYSQIRLLNIFIQTMMLFLIAYLMAKRKLINNIFDFVVSIFFIFPFVIGMSLQFSSVYYIFLISTIIMLKYNEKLKDKYIYFFMLIGILTSYFDLFSFPILGLGMALLFNFMLNKKESLKDNILDIIKLSMFWALGYFGMWIGKWIIGSILCHDNFFDLALGAAKARSSSGTGRIGAIITNLEVYMHKVYIVILFPILCYHIICSFKKRKNITKKTLLDSIPYLIICLIPIVWYFVMAQHSTIHYWFTNKSLVVSIFGFLLLLNSLHNSKKIN